MAFGFSSIWILLMALMMGGEDSLSGYVSPEAYWQSRDMAYEVEVLAELLAAPAVNPDDMDQWIVGLGADDFKDREAASEALASFGAQALPLLQEAAQSDDPEVARRAKDLIENVQPVDAEIKAMDQWMAVFSLSKIDHPEARKILQKVAEGPAGDLQVLAEKQLALSEKVLAPLPSAQIVLSGFPDDTLGFAQMTIPQQSGSLVKTIHETPYMQESLIRLLAEIGDLRIRRVTATLNQGIWLDQNGQITLRLEMEYDADKVATFLEKHRFQMQEIQGVKMGRADKLTVVLADAHNILLTYHTQPEEMPSYAQIQQLLNGNVTTRFSDELQAVMTEVPEVADLKVVALFPDEVAGHFSDEIAGLDKVFAFANLEQGALKLDVGIVHKKAASADELRDFIQAQIAEGKVEIQNQNDPQLAPILSTLNSAKVTSVDERNTFTVQIPETLPFIYIQMMGRAQQMHREMMDQQEVVAPARMFH